MSMDLLSFEQAEHGIYLSLIMRLCSHLRLNRLSERCRRIRNDFVFAMTANWNELSNEQLKACSHPCCT